MEIRLNNVQIAEFLIACVRCRVEEFIRQMGGEVELSFLFLKECSPLAELVSQGKIRLAVGHRLFPDLDTLSRFATLQEPQELFVKITMVSE